MLPGTTSHSPPEEGGELVPAVLGLRRSAAPTSGATITLHMASPDHPRAARSFPDTDPCADRPHGAIGPLRWGLMACKGGPSAVGLSTPAEKSHTRSNYVLPKAGD